MIGPTMFKLLSEEKQDKEIRLNFKEMMDMLPRKKCSFHIWFEKESEEWRIPFDEFEYTLDDNNGIAWEDDHIYVEKMLSKEGMRKKANQNPELWNEITKLKEILKCGSIGIYPIVKKREGMYGVEFAMDTGIHRRIALGMKADDWVERLVIEIESVGFNIDLREVRMIAIFDHKKAESQAYEELKKWAKEISKEFTLLNEILNERFTLYATKIEEWIEKEEGIEIIRRELIERDYYVYP